MKTFLRKMSTPFRVERTSDTASSTTLISPYSEDISRAGSLRDGGSELQAPVTNNGGFLTAGIVGHVQPDSSTSPISPHPPGSSSIMQSISSSSISSGRSTPHASTANVAQVKPGSSSSRAVTPQQAAVTSKVPLPVVPQQPSQAPPPPLRHNYDEGGVTIAVARHCPTALRRQNWSVNDFELRKLMYNGAISMVYHTVDHRSGMTVALKLYKRAKLNEIERHQVAREIKLHVDLAHDSIISLYAAWKDRAYVYLALEWAPGGDVYQYLRANNGVLAEEIAVPLIMEPFMAGIENLHIKGLIHRDIKPENILLNNSFQVKIADFGLSIDSRSEIANTRLGTIDYLAPEILNCPVKEHPEDHKQNPSTGYTEKVDCWSIGVLAYELLVGHAPFSSSTVQETLRLIRTKVVVYPEDVLSPDAISFIRSALVRDPTQRPSVTQLLDHPWIRRYSRRNPSDKPCIRSGGRRISEGSYLRHGVAPERIIVLKKPMSLFTSTTPTATSSINGMHPATTASWSTPSTSHTTKSGSAQSAGGMQETSTTNVATAASAGTVGLPIPRTLSTTPSQRSRMQQATAMPHSQTHAPAEDQDLDSASLLLALPGAIQAPADATQAPCLYQKSHTSRLAGASGKWDATAMILPGKLAAAGASHTTDHSTPQSVERTCSGPQSNTAGHGLFSASSKPTPEVAPISKKAGLGSRSKIFAMFQSAA